MREAKELLLATKPFAREQRWRSWWHLWSTLVAYIVTLVLCCLDVLPLPLRFAASILSGLVIVRLFIIYHDYQHGTILTKSVVARMLMNGYGMLVLSPPSIWNRSHNHHHFHNSKIQSLNIGSFPVMTREAYAKATWKERWSYAMSRHPVTILCGYLTIFFYGIALRSFLINPKEHIDSGIAVAMHLAMVVAMAIYAPLLLVLVLLLPLSIACGMGSYLFYAQHNFPGVRLRPREEWSYVFAAFESSSYIKMGWLMRWFTGNIGYHHVHHLNAKIPFYRLPETMHALEELQSPRTTSLAPWDVWRCFRLKVWDSKQDRYISFREARLPSPAA